MSDFTSDFWSYYVAVITVVSIVACAVPLWPKRSRRAPGQQAGCRHSRSGTRTAACTATAAARAHLEREG